MQQTLSRKVLVHETTTDFTLRVTKVTSFYMSNRYGYVFCVVSSQVLVVKRIFIFLVTNKLV